MIPIQDRLSRNWPGVLILPVIVLSMLALAVFGGCSVTSVRLGIEAGQGDLQADTIGMKGKLKLDADVDGAALPLSELGGD